MKTIAYIGWLGHHNVGDEACLIAIQEMLGHKYKIISWDQGPWKPKKLPDLCILGGGTLLDIGYGRREKTLLFPMSAKGVPIIIWGSGIVDNHGDTIHPKVMRLLNYAKYVGVRGPISQKILQKRGFHKAQIVGDPALCYPVKRFTMSPMGLMLSDIGSTAHVSINIGHTRNNLYGTEKHVEDQCIRLVRNLDKRRMRTTLFSVWPDDNAMIKRVKQRINDLTLTHTHDMWLMKKTNNQEENIDSLLWKLRRHTSYVIGMKLHSVVLAAAIDIPFISLAYRRKCIDFAQSVGANDWWIKTNENWGDILPDKLEKLGDNVHKVCDTVLAKKGKYIAKHLEITNLAIKILEKG